MKEKLEKQRKNMKKLQKARAAVDASMFLDVEATVDNTDEEDGDEVNDCPLYTHSLVCI